MCGVWCSVCIIYDVCVMYLFCVCVCSLLFIGCDVFDFFVVCGEVCVMCWMSVWFVV